MGFKKYIFFIALLFNFWSFYGFQNNNSPNYIVIFVDDMGYGDLGVYGNPTISTPHLDKMAYEGQKWTQFYSAASVCTPSRAALLTGRLPVRSGMASSKNPVLFPNSLSGLPATELTLAEKLKEKNYKTAIVGKWHLGHTKNYLPNNHGFDYYFGIPYSNDMDKINNNNYWSEYENKELSSDSYNVPLMENFDIIERPVDQTTITSRYVDKTLQLINNYKNDNFFIYLSHNLPHIPLYASKRFLGKSKRGLYGDVIEEIDYGVGLIINELKKLNLDKKTIVVFTSDNGPWLVYKSHSGSAGLLRNGKGTTWEGGVRVPTIFWGANIKPGLINEIGSTLDIYTTFLALAKIDTQKNMIVDGYDLSETLLRKKESQRDEMFFYKGDELFAVRLGDFKLHLKTTDWFKEPKKHNPPLLFNLNIDPSEKFNISSKNPEKVKEILELIKVHNLRLVRGKNQLDIRS
jgi:arylsulfatase A-like enzyme|tara:strand:- start:1403 stop:2785 length:1383 start_codon:yes stop_codon:yes gene_type:complete